MGNTQTSGTGMVTIDEEALRARHRKMRRNVLKSEYDSLVAEANKPNGERYRSRAVLLERIRHVRDRMEQLERAEMNFDRILNIKQTADIVQEVKDLMKSTAGLPSVDHIHDLEDCIAEQQDSLNEIEEAFKQPWNKDRKELTEESFQAQLMDLTGRGGAPGDSSGETPMTEHKFPKTPQVVRKYQSSPQRTSVLEA